MTKAYMTQGIKSSVWLFIFIAILSPCAFAAMIPSDTVPKQVQGIWLLVSIYKTPNIQGIDDSESISLVGTRLTIGGNWIASCKQRVDISKVSISTESSREFFEGTKGVSFKNVKVRLARIQYINMTDDDTGNCFGTYEIPGVQLFVKGPNEILVYFSGVFYRALRVSNSGRRVHI